MPGVANSTMKWPNFGCRLPACSFSPWVMMRPGAGWSEGPAGLGVEDGGPGKVEIYGDALPRPADIMGLELGEHRLAAEAEACIAARARRLHQLDRGLEPGAAGRRLGGGGAAHML